MQTTLHPIHAVYDGLFNTASGKKINLNEPDIDSISIQDIAHALSNLCRFGGHTSIFYSVAQHSVLVASLAPDDLKKEALLHDASEAYLGDVIKPLKVMLGSVYENIEDTFIQTIAAAFDLDHAKLLQVKKYDVLALELEHIAFQKREPGRLVEIMTDKMLLINGMYVFAPPVAKSVFLNHFQKYFL